MRIVGVVEDIVQARSEDGPRPAIYIPYGQAEINQLLRFRTVVRTSEPLASVLPELRRSLAAGGWTLIGAESMERMLVESRASPRFRTGLVAGFALVALLLAAIGLHGSLAHNVRRRRRELGVRMALGADRWSVLRMVLGQGMRLAGVGLGIGLLVTLASSRVLAAFLYGMRPNDPVTLGAVVVILLIVSVVACLMPARRATAVDPVEVLSSE
jgi:ABC-type antimicrobial peptide transport system permease subunit